MKLVTPGPEEFSKLVSAADKNPNELSRSSYIRTKLGSICYEYFFEGLKVILCIFLQAEEFSERCAVDDPKFLGYLPDLSSNISAACNCEEVDSFMQTIGEGMPVSPFSPL